MPSSATPNTPARRAFRIWTRCSSPATSSPAFSPRARSSNPQNQFTTSKSPASEKKLKDKAFARGVNRDDVINGAKELGVDLDQHIAFCLAAMQRDAEALGLAG